MRYARTVSGVWFRPRMQAWYMRCCDCGLVHRVDFRVVRGLMRTTRLRRRIKR